MSTMTMYLVVTVVSLWLACIAIIASAPTSTTDTTPVTRLSIQQAQEALKDFAEYIQSAGDPGSNGTRASTQPPVHLADLGCRYDENMEIDCRPTNSTSETRLSIQQAQEVYKNLAEYIQSAGDPGSNGTRASTQPPVNLADLGCRYDENMEIVCS